MQYLYRVGYTDSAGWHWTILNTELHHHHSCTWTPTTAGAYTLVVWARLVGHTANYDQYAAIPYQITSAAADRGRARRESRLAAAGQHGDHPDRHAHRRRRRQVQYLFRVGYDRRGLAVDETQHRSYTTTASCTWTPATAENYTLVVWARLIGHTDSYDQYITITYQVTALPTAP